MKLRLIGFTAVRVGERTEWTFAELGDSEGGSTVVEITSGDSTAQVARMCAELVASITSDPIDDESKIASLLGLDDSKLRATPALATAVGALRTAVTTLQSHRRCVSLTEGLGGVAQESVELYANINRGLFLTPRTPSDFASAAERAVSEGFVTVKCAPFDEVEPGVGAAALESAEPGLARVAAVREAVGPGVRVLVDCHSRFDVGSAPVVAERLAALDVGWCEEPVEPTRDPGGLRDIAGRVSMLVAGGESGYGRDFFDDLVRRQAVRVVMPDVKHCGGVAEACVVGRSAMLAGAQVSLHSPSGPVSMLASGHVTAAMRGALPLEHAVHEASWRAEVLDPPELIEGGRLAIPTGPGLGAALDPVVVRRRGRRWRP